MNRPLQEALTDAIVSVAQKDCGAFSGIHAWALVSQLEPAHQATLRLYAQGLAQRLVKEVEDAKLGRGRVTDRRLDQRVRRGEPAALTPKEPQP